MPDENKINRMFLNLKIIWIVIIIFLILYLIIGLFLKSNIKLDLDENNFNLIRIILYIFAFIELALAIYMRKFILSEKYQYNLHGLTQEQIILKKYFIANIITFAIFESIGIYGLVLLIFGNNSFDLYIMLLISVTFLFIYRPKKDELEILIKENLDKIKKDKK